MANKGCAASHRLDLQAARECSGWSRRVCGQLLCQAATVLVPFILPACSTDEPIIQRERFITLATEALLDHYTELRRGDISLSDDRFVIFCHERTPCTALLKFELVPGTDVYEKFETKEVTVSVRESGRATLELSRYGGLVAFGSSI